MVGATHRAKMVNPVCGDEVEVLLRVADGRVAEVTFTGQGCAISQASASLLTEALTDRPLAEVPALLQRVAKLWQEGEPEASVAEEGELAALAGVRAFPARQRCASLAWEALAAALQAR